MKWADVAIRFSFIRARTCLCVSLSPTTISNSSLPYGICSKSPSPRNTRVSVKRSFSRRPIAFIKPT